MGFTAITAHSGCENTPDNSMESIRTGIALGADCVEIDVRMDGRGVLRLNHDAAADYENAVPLETALRTIAAGGVSVNCDLKEARALYPVLEMADACGMGADRLIFSGSVDVGLLLKDSGIVRRASIYLNSEEICRWLAPEMPDTRQAHAQYLTEHSAAVAEWMRGIGVKVLNAPYQYTSDALIAAMQREGIGLSLWTVNDEADQARLLRAGLVNMTTRRVERALRLRREITG